jgi:hemerythrin
MEILRAEEDPCTALDPGLELGRDVWVQAGQTHDIPKARKDCHWHFSTRSVIRINAGSDDESILKTKARVADMELIHWDQKFCVSLPEINADHKELAQCINELYAAVAAGKERAEVKAFFGKVAQKFRAHFEHEEKLMSTHGYPGYDAHRADHQAVLSDIGDIAKDFADGVFDYDPEKALAQRLTDWFLEHTRIYDTPMCEFLEQKALH